MIHMKRLLSFTLLLIICFSLPALAEKNKYDRGILLKTFIPKGQWMVGTTFSYSEHVDENFEFLSVLKDIESDVYPSLSISFNTDRNSSGIISVSGGDSLILVLIRIWEIFLSNWEMT